MIEHMLVRQPGIGMARLPDGLELWSVHDRWVERFNATASLVLLLCDGSRTLSNIVDTLCNVYPDDVSAIRQDVAALVANLKVRGIIQEKSTEPLPRSAARRLLKVVFVGFWLGFDTRRNYFVCMLSHLFDPMLVDQGSDDIDLTFFSSCVLSDNPKPAVMSGRSKLIYVGLNDEMPGSTGYDYAFTTGTAQDSSVAGRHFRLPIWAMFTDWTGYGRATSYLAHDRRLPAPFHPEAACRHLQRALQLQCCGIQAFGGTDDHLEPLLSSGAARQHSSRRATPSDKNTKLTIGIATHNDYDGVYFTVQSLRLYHADCLDNIEILIVDNDPDGSCGSAVREFVQSVDTCRYVPFVDFKGTCVKDLVFRDARSEVVLCLDSHVLVFPGAVKRLMRFFDAHKECHDLLQGPLFDDGLRPCGTHWDLRWRNGHLGVWALDERGADPDSAPFEIDAQGMGLFACRKEAWLGFSPRFAGFGWEEGYIHEKFRRAGQRTFCLPFLRWIHRFGPHPKGVTYPLSWKDRIRNLIIGHWELNLNADSAKEHFREVLGTEMFARIADEIDDEMSSPFFEFEVAYYVDTEGDPLLWDDVLKRLKSLGIHRPRRFVSVDATKPSTMNRVLGHQAIVRFAERTRLQSVIVFENVDALPALARPAVAQSIKELRQTSWSIFAIAGTKDGGGPSQNGSERYDDVGAGETYAIAYHCRAFQDVIDRLSSADDGVGSRAGSLESYLRGIGGEAFAWRLPSNLGTYTNPTKS